MNGGVFDKSVPGAVEFESRFLYQDLLGDWASRRLQLPLGTFNGTTYKADIQYGSNFVLLTNVVPEPMHLLLVGAFGASAIGWYRRRVTSRAAAPRDKP